MSEKTALDRVIDVSYSRFPQIAAEASIELEALRTEVSALKDQVALCHKTVAGYDIALRLWNSPGGEMIVQEARAWERVRHIWDSKVWRDAGWESFVCRLRDEFEVQCHRLDQLSKPVVTTETPRD